jgi:class 3 adenylate cyclase/predicted ATPase
VDDEVERLQRAIAALKAQRAALGDDATDLALGPLQQRLAQLEQAAAPPAQQLRQVSVLFIDVVGSTSLSQHLSPEQIHAVMDVTLAAFTRIVDAHGGRVLQYAGDSLLAAFGAPVAHEDDARRAVQAGLAILADAVAQAEAVRRRHGHEGFGVRAGIATGPVLLGGGVDGEQSIRGMTVNLAARMEQTAPHGRLRICPDTQRLVRGLFELEPQPPLAVKGRDEPIATWLVQRAARDAATQARRGVDGVATPLVGRAAPLAALRQALADWRAATAAAVRVACVVGEAGLGKTRLLAELRRTEPGLRWLDAQAGERDQGRPYGLMRQLFAAPLRLLDSDPAALARSKWLEGMAPLLRSAGDAAVLGHLLGIDFAAHAEVAALQHEQRQLRDRGFHHATQALRALAAGGAPLALLLDDVHWADPGTLDFVDHLQAAGPELALFVVALARPQLDEQRPGWSAAPGRLRLPLDALADADAGALADALLARLQPPSAALREQLIETADGNPFFMEEMVNLLVDRGAIVADGDAWRLREPVADAPRLPGTLAGVLQARLDALPPALVQVLQRAAIVGHAFWDDALRALGPDPEPGPALDGLCARALVVPRPASRLEGRREFVFRHHLLHQVCYARVLERDRVPAHARIARWLESLPGEHPMELVAEHHERGAEPERARAAWQRAAVQAQARYANAQALAHAERARTLTPPAQLRERFALSLLCAQVLALLGEPQRLQHELDALRQLAELAGDAALRAQAADRQARTLLDSGDALGALTPAEQAAALAQQALPALAAPAGLVVVQALNRLGRYADAQRAAARVLEQARRNGDRRTEGALLNDLGIIADDHGDFGAAIEHYRRALQCHLETGNRSHEAGVLSNLGYAELNVGDFAAAEPRFAAARELFAQIGQRAPEAVVRVNLALVALHRGHPAQAIEQVQHALPMLRATRSRAAEAAARRVSGQARLALGDAGAACTELRAAHDAFRALDLRHLAAEAQASLAEAQLAAGERDAALRASREVLDSLQRGVPLEGTEEPMKVYLCCWRVLHACGDDRAGAVLVQARQALLERAARIGDAARRESYLEAVPHHRALMRGEAAAPGAG